MISPIVSVTVSKSIISCNVLLEEDLAPTKSSSSNADVASQKRREEAACPNSDIRKIIEKDDESTLEKEDKKRIMATRSMFYSLNEKFEQLLKFKPIRKLQLWQVEVNLAAAYTMF